MVEQVGAQIHVTGVVQGVGFRPFVYGLAARHALKGWVRNTSAGVDIAIDGTPAELSSFVQAISVEAPPLAHVDSVSVEHRPCAGYSSFEILNSHVVDDAFQPISADVAVCSDCLDELFDPANRRHRYPFINCTNCGPRFTIIRDIPYDRPNTTMAGFVMCAACQAEYEDPSNRRFHAQPIACPDCGPQISLEMGGERIATGEEALGPALALLRDGKIVAVKGLGGFHLACDATNIRAVTELRRRKLRVDKPFALMMPSISVAESHCNLTDLDRELLSSRERPIVLLSRKSASCIAHEVAPGQQTLGVMLPYTPLHHLLMGPAREQTVPKSYLPTALVMTSGNLSEEPIVSDNDEARERLAGLADAILMSDRDIHAKCDDSVVRVFAPGVAQPSGTAKNAGHVFPLRRSRGYAPFPVLLPMNAPLLLATGGELKNAFCITRDRYAFMSQHIGDLQNYETLTSFETSVDHFERLFRVRPRMLAYDLHPDYLATRYALERAEREELPAVGVQHHHAHTAACMVENGLTGNRPVIGVAFDGTGFGDDGAIWGGEFLLADYAGYRRMYHLKYIPMPGGDKAVSEPWRLALAWLRRAGLAWQDDLAPVAATTPEQRSVLENQIEKSVNSPLTSSMGRLFDAVSALAGVRQKVNYEAQAAVEFEAVADPAEQGAYEFGIQQNGGLVDPVPLIESVVTDLRIGTPTQVISARFHNAISKMVVQVCGAIRDPTQSNVVALSGGVWQNMTLLRRTVDLLRACGFTVYVHRVVPTNDGGIALGQAAVAAFKSRAEEGR